MGTMHTVGPWSVSEIGLPVLRICAPHGGECAVVYDSPKNHDRAEQLANARLIAAAPELLEAAIELRQRQRDYLADPAGHRDNEKGRLVGIAAEKLDAAIAKATS